MNGTGIPTFTVIIFTFYRPGTDDRIVKDIAEWTKPGRGHISKFLAVHGYGAPWTPSDIDPIMEVRTGRPGDPVKTYRIRWGVPAGKGKRKERLCLDFDGTLLDMEEFVVL